LVSAKTSGAGGRLSCIYALTMDGRVSQKPWMVRRNLPEIIQLKVILS